MNAAQRHVIAVGLIFVALTCIFPPLTGRTGDVVTAQGRGFLLSPQLYSSRVPTGGYAPRRIDYQRLPLEWVAIGALVAAWLIRLGDGR